MKVMMCNPAVKVPLEDNKERFYVKAGSRWPWSCVKSVDEDFIPPFPFFLAYTASVLRDEGFEVGALDGVALNLEKDAYMERVKAFAPDVIVLETAMHAFLYDVDMAKDFKEALPGCVIVFAGPHATTYADKILQDYPHIDIVLRGEYEHLTRDVCLRLKAGEKTLDIDGVCYRQEDGTPIISEAKGRIKDINELPYPAYDLFPSHEKADLTRYGDGVITYKPAATMHSSRGCPFKCDFCLWIQVMYDNGKYRVFTPERVVDEMEHLISTYGVREIYFDDDDFCVNKKHVLGICDEIKKRGLKIHWSCMGDAMSSDEEMIKAMAEAGCIFMKFGVESGNRDILKKIGKPLKPERAVEVSQWCRKYGIMTHATFVFGLYNDTMDTMKETLTLANRIKFDYAQASIATPFPGTRLYDKLVEDGALKDVDYTMFDGTQSCAFNSENLTSAEVVAFRRKAIRSMIAHKAVDPLWWRNYLRRNYTLYREHGIRTVLEPLKALLRL